jgi:hypothetical protein
MPSSPSSGSGDAVCGSVEPVLLWAGFVFWSAPVVALVAL